MAKPPVFSRAHRRAIVIETLVSTMLNGLAPTGIIWLIGLPPPQAISGPGGLAAGAVLATLLCTFLMTIVMTLLIRARVRRGGVPAVDQAARDGSWLRLAPRNLPVRAALLTAIMLVVAPASAVALVRLSGLLPFDSVDFAVFNLMFGVLLGLLAAPVVSAAALADPVTPSAVRRPGLAR